FAGEHQRWHLAQLLGRLGDGAGLGPLRLLRRGQAGHGFGQLGVQGTIFGRVHPTKSRTSRPATGQVAHSPDTASVPPAPARADAEAPISGGKVAAGVADVLERTTRRP